MVLPCFEFVLQNFFSLKRLKFLVCYLFFHCFRFVCLCVLTDGRQLKVAASVGPYGAILYDLSEYHGRYVDSMSSSVSSNSSANVDTRHDVTDPCICLCVLNMLV